MSFFDIFTVYYWKQNYNIFKQFIYLFFYSMFYQPPKERIRPTSFGGTSMHNPDFGNGRDGGGGGGSNYRGPQQGDNRGGVDRFRNVRRIPRGGMGG